MEEAQIIHNRISKLLSLSQIKFVLQDIYGNAAKVLKVLCAAQLGGFSLDLWVNY